MNENNFDKKANILIKKWLIRCISKKNNISKRKRKQLFYMTIEQLEVLERDGIHERR